MLHRSAKRKGRASEKLLRRQADAFAHLSLAALLNLLFLIKGEWGSIGDYVTTQRAIRVLIGDELFWAEPQKSSPAPIELVQ
jgi:hypothetical protein